MMRSFRGAVALAAVVGLAGTAHSHEFVAKPAAMTVSAGAELQVAGLSTHVFLISQELEAPKDVKVGYYVEGKRTDIAVKPDDKTLAYDGALTAPSALPSSSRARASSANLGHDPRGV